MASVCTYERLEARAYLLGLRYPPELRQDSHAEKIHLLACVLPAKKKEMRLIGKIASFE